MGDKDDGNAPLRHAADGIQQSLGFFFRQHGGGFIQNQKAQLLLAQLAGNLGKLLVPHGHGVDGHVRVNVNAHFLNGPGAALSHLTTVQGIQPLAKNL